MRELITAGHDVTLLTNFNDGTWEEAKEKFPFLNEPRGVTGFSRGETDQTGKGDLRTPRQHFQP